MSDCSYARISPPTLHYHGRTAVEQPVEQKSVLIVEDDLHVREMLTAVLESTFKVMAAGTVGEALAHLDAGRPDIVLCDVYLPECNGFTLIGKLRSHGDMKGVPVVMTSGWEDGTSAQRSQEVGAAAFLPKPFTTQELHRVLTKHLAGNADCEAVSLQAA